MKYFSVLKHLPLAAAETIHQVQNTVVIRDFLYLLPCMNFWWGEEKSLNCFSPHSCFLVVGFAVFCFVL